MKSQADIISAVIVIVIAIILFSTAYMWGIPLIRKRQDTALVERVKSYFDRENVNSLARKIEFVAKYGGEDTFSLDTNGIWVLYPYDIASSENNSIHFTFSAIVSNIGVNRGWIPPCEGIGQVGIDPPSVVCARADESSQGFNITYKTWFRELKESETKSHKINLLAFGPTSSTGKTIRISRGNVYSTSVAGKTLIITEIKLLLI